MEMERKTEWSLHDKYTFFKVVNTLFLIDGIIGFAIAAYLMSEVAEVTGQSTLSLLMGWPVIGIMKVLILASLGYRAAANQKILALKVYGWLMVVAVVANTALFIVGLVYSISHSNSNGNVNTIVWTSVLSVIELLLLISCAVGGFRLAYSFKEDKFGPSPYGRFDSTTST